MKLHNSFFLPISSIEKQSEQIPDSLNDKTNTPRTTIQNGLNINAKDNSPRKSKIIIKHLLLCKIIFLLTTIHIGAI